MCTKTTKHWWHNIQEEKSTTEYHNKKWRDGTIFRQLHHSNVLHYLAADMWGCWGLGCCCEIWLGKTFFEIALGINTLCILSWHAKSQAHRLTSKAADLSPLAVFSLVYLQSVIINIIRKSARTFMAWSYLQGKEIEMLSHLSMNS